ncbi:MAG TPA: T9SS type A sorting domain-containing protein [Ignavibacteriaceae bacterium]|nr:T9SS type A sorting domain-containing protein [Ignavibacteriaceae bacterium]
MKTILISSCLLLFLIASPAKAQEWEFVGLDSLLIKQLYVFGDTIYAGTVVRNGANISAGLYFTSDSGNNWLQLDSVLGEAPIVDLEFFRECRDTFYLVKGGSVSSPNAKLYITTDGGNSWLLINPLENISIVWIGVSFFNKTEVYAKESHYIPAGWFATVYRSLDGGNNWDEITINLPSSSHGRNLAFNLSMIDSNKLYAAVDDMLVGEYFFISTNKGNSWNYLSVPPSVPAELITDGVISERIYMSSSFVSEDDGFTWELENSGLPDTSYYLSFYENPRYTNEIYTIRTDGIYKSEKEIISWVRIEGSENLPLNLGVGGFSYLDIGQINNFAVNLKDNKIYVGTISGIYRKEQTTEVKIVEFENLSGFILHQNYPNPFNPSTTIKYAVPKNSNISLVVYDVLGSEITTLVNEEKLTGRYEVRFDATGLPSGIYFYILNADTKNGERVREGKKMILLK